MANIAQYCPILAKTRPRAIRINTSLVASLNCNLKFDKIQMSRHLQKKQMEEAEIQKTSEKDEYKDARKIRKYTQTNNKQTHARTLTHTHTHM